MSIHERKMVLSGGVISAPLFDEIFDLAGTDTPQLVIDGSPCVTQESLDNKRRTWKKIAEDKNIPEPLMIQDYADEPLSRDRANALLDRADVLYVTGGASRNAINRWNEAGLTTDMRERVDSGDVVASGGSAGAMIWFNVGFSDSNYYDVEKGEHWDFEPVEEAKMFGSWVMAHYSDTDNLGRSKQALFSSFLHEHEGEWEYAVGIDTYAALVCVSGLAHVRSLLPQTQEYKDYLANVHLYVDDESNPSRLSDGDVIPMHGM